MDYSQRIARLQARLRRQKIDAFLVGQPENRRYLSGFTSTDHSIAESSGVLLIPARGQIRLLTDFRYKLQAEGEVPWAEVILYPKGLLAILGELLPDLGVARLAFESHYTLHSSAARMQEKLGAKGIELLPAEGIVETMRQVKDEEEIELIRRSVRLNEEVFAGVFGSLDGAETEIDIALAIETAMRRRGAEGPSFSTIVASGENGALPHAVPGLTRIKPGASLTIDMGLILDGYCSDMTRTFVPGEATARYVELHRLVRRAQLAGMAAIRAGVRAAAVDRAARRIIAEAGYGDCFGHSLGHGVGLAVHEDPRVSFRNNRQLRPGMVVTVEPGIYIPGWGGIRLENMVVVREDGCENLNSDTTWLDI